MCKCFRRQVAAAFARVCREGPSEEMAFSVITSRHPCEDLRKGI